MKILCGTILQIKTKQICVLFYRHSGKKWFEITGLDLSSDNIYRKRFMGQPATYVTKLGTMLPEEMLTHRLPRLRSYAKLYLAATSSAAASH